MSGYINHITLNGVTRSFEDTAGRTGVAPIESTSSASKAYAIGDYLWYNDILYKVTAAISSGGTIGPGTNVIQVTLSADVKAAGDAIGSLNNAINAIAASVDASDFTWTFGSNYDLSGNIVSFPGFALSGFISTENIKGIINTTGNIGIDGKTTNLHINEFNSSGTWLRRVPTNQNPEHIFSDDCSQVRLAYGYGLASGVTMTSAILSQYFSAKVFVEMESKADAEAAKAAMEEEINFATNKYNIGTVATWVDGKSVYYINGLVITDNNFSYTQIDVSAMQNRAYAIHTSAQDSYGVVFKTAEGAWIEGYRNPATIGYSYDISGTIPGNAAIILIPCKTTDKDSMRFVVDGKQIDEVNQLLDNFDTHYNSKFINNEYFFVKDNALICSKTKIASAGIMAKYCMADIGDTITTVRCRCKFKGGTITLITTSRNAVGFIDSIVLGSVHVSYTRTNVNVSAFYIGDGDTIPTLHDIAVINYDTELPAGDTEYEIGFDFLGSGNLKVYLPDGTNQTVNSSIFDEKNGRYVIYEMYFVNLNPNDEATYNFNRPTFTGFYAKASTGIALRDNFARSDGDIGTAPSGHVYRLGRNAATGDTIYDEVNNIPQP